MYRSEWNPLDQCFRVTTRRGTVVKLCHSLPQAMEATIEAASHLSDDQHEFRILCTRLRRRMRMRERIGYLKYLRAWRTE